MKNNSEFGLRDIVAVAVNSLDAGIESRKDTIDRICNFVEETYIRKQAIEALPVEAMYNLNESYGISFDVMAGSIKDIKIENS